MDDNYYMQLALQQAQIAANKQEIPIGAVLVKDKKVIAQAHNMRETWQDGTAHAEIIVVKQACKLLNTWRLTGCTLYVTVEPCPMCAGALIMSRLDRLVYGCADSKAGACESLFNIVNNPNLNHRLKVTAGICETECRKIIKDFFLAKRTKNK